MDWPIVFAQGGNEGVPSYYSSATSDERPAIITRSKRELVSAILDEITWLFRDNYKEIAPASTSGTTEDLGKL